MISEFRLKLNEQQIFPMINFWITNSYNRYHKRKIYGEKLSAFASFCLWIFLTSFLSVFNYVWRNKTGNGKSVCILINLLCKKFLVIYEEILLTKIKISRKNLWCLLFFKYFILLLYGEETNVLKFNY
jgi:hypothetical protein